jgi:hypothetical protein
MLRIWVVRMELFVLLSNTQYKGRRVSVKGEGGVAAHFSKSREKWGTPS